MKGFFSLFFVVLMGSFAAFAQHDDHEAQHTDNMHQDDDHATGPCGIAAHHEAEEYPMSETAFHHISDQNVFSIGPLQLPLPCILYEPGKGVSVFSSKHFNPDSHGHGATTHKGFVLQYGIVKRIKDHAFPEGEQVEVSGYKDEDKVINDKELREVSYACINGELYELESSSKADFGLFGGAVNTFYDFSITKNVLSMLLTAFLLGWMFIAVAKRYQQREGQAPKGMQSFIEPIYIFIRDDVAKSMIGEEKYERFLPFLMSIFFFILALNLVGMVPFFGNPNITGNLAVTLTLAIFAFLVTNLNGNANYWQHIFWMPGIPVPVKIIMAPIEILSLFLKPFTLLVRLFANITAGHIVVLSFVGLIFIFGEMGTNVTGGVIGIVVSVLLTMFMSALELLVAFIQAFIFAILTASYIGAAVIEDHH